MQKSFFRYVVLLCCVGFQILSADVWNAPYSEEMRQGNRLFFSYGSAPKHLDPVRSYSSNEWMFLGQIYEPMLQYNYLKRPYVLEPLTLKKMPTVDYNASTDTTTYYFDLRDDIFYAPHPAFVKEANGTLLYGALSKADVADIASVYDLPQKATRQVVAADYLYAIKRMAVRQYHSPILDTMIPYIIGLEDYSKKVTQEVAKCQKEGRVPDLREGTISGVKTVGTFGLQIAIHGRYPQFLYWMAMNFFAPIPWEADYFYHQEVLRAKNISLDTAPIGSGAYYLAKSNPAAQMVLRRNPRFHKEYYPSLSSKEVADMGLSPSLLHDANQTLPFVDEVHYRLEKESIPLWNMFLQGYYDASGVSADTFNQAVQIGSSGSMRLSGKMQEKEIKMLTSVAPSIFYMAFNMVDPVVGGYTPSAKKLRQAISIAQDEEEYISIFMNERGVAAQGPIPPGIFGYLKGEEGTNKVIYRWREGKRVRRSLDEAKALLAEAGYPNGISTKSGKRLKLYYDTTATGPDDRALIEWRRKQFAKLGIELVVRATDYNRFQEKVRKGEVQLFSWGWNADYPDPENFLFLLYGKNAAVTTQGAGVNSANYQNPAFDRLFEQIRTMENTPERLEKIRRMVRIAQEDAPWVWGVHPKSLSLVHSWYHNVVANAMANNTLKYKRVDTKKRLEKQHEWNQPVLWPFGLLVGIAVGLWWWVRRLYVARQEVVMLPQRGVRR